jgi:DNA-binding response OmpR family regulator
VLFVDDESALHKIAEEALTDRGYRELTAEDGASALALFDLIEIDVDIVTTDQIW